MILTVTLGPRPFPLTPWLNVLFKTHPSYVVTGGGGRKIGGKLMIKAKIDKKEAKTAEERGQN